MIINKMMTILWMLAGAPAMAGPTVNYGELAEKCDDATSPECCKASIEAMKAGKFEPLPQNGCPSGKRAEKLKCADSLSWCEPIPKPSPLKSHKK